MDFRIVSLVYGELYTDCFLNYSIPSMLSLNNIPSIYPFANIGLFIYTHTNEEVYRITNELSKLKLPISTRVQVTPYPNNQNDFWEHFTMRNPGSSMLFSNADCIWADGSLSYIVNSLMEGNVAIYPPFVPVALETIQPELDSFKSDNIINLSTLQVQQLAIKHLSPWAGCWYYKSQNTTDWPEAMLVPVGTEGILFYHVCQPFQAFSPGSFEVVGTWYINADFNTHKIDSVQDSNKCIALNLQPLQKQLRPESIDNSMDLPGHSIAQLIQYLQFRGAAPFNVGNTSAFLKHPRYRNPPAFNIEAFKRPWRISLVENPTKELWDKVEREMEEGIVREIINSNGPEMRKADNPISHKDILGTLEWLNPVIAGRFPQAVLEYLSN